jgi:hypothetical protein
MQLHPDPALAETVLAVHLVVIGFNVFGLVAIPLGAWRGWRFVRVRWWRWLHVASMAAVALQAALGRACVLTDIEAELTGAGSNAPPLIMTVVNRVIFWPLPMWAFTVLYALLFAYVLALLKLVPTRSPD